MVESFKDHWDDLTREADQTNERLRQRALRVAHRLARILTRDYRAKRVVAFGSVTHPGRFDARSDIDLGVEGIPPERFFEALGRLMMKTRFTVDLKPMDSVPPRLRSRIERGVLLHEAR